MFTGIVTEVGTLSDVRRHDGGVDLVVEAPATAARLGLGASVALNGVCQTVVEMPDGTGPAARRFRVQAVGATLDRTTMGRLATGDRINLEPSLRAGDELGGHLVMGHVDGMARVTKFVAEVPDDPDTAWYLTLNLPAELARFAAPRGSIAVDGVSLTVAGLAERADGGADVTISLIPHTLTHTIAGGYRPGQTVNVEADTMARYVDRLLAARAEAPGVGR